MTTRHVQRQVSGVFRSAPYLARHGEATTDEDVLTSAGRDQAVLLGRRLRGTPITVVRHGPLPRARQTAQLVAQHLPGATLIATAAAGDFIPHVPSRDELPAATADRLLGFLDSVDAAEGERGRILARAALEEFTGPVPDPAGPLDTGPLATGSHELVVTHAFTIGWLVREALHAPPWRWLDLNFAHAALTVIRYAPGRAATLLCLNDMAHLPGALRWTGFPPDLRL